MKEFLFDILPLKASIGRLMVSSFLETPFFVVGCGRSGTTALGRALNEHPAILFSSNEAPFGYHVAEIGFEYHCGETRKWYQTEIAYSSLQVREHLRQPACAAPDVHLVAQPRDESSWTRDAS